MSDLDFVVEFQVTVPTFSGLSQGKASTRSGYRRPGPVSQDGIKRQ
ncbi:MAG: hypothetical protein HKN19_01415 [Halioglobus sp.]|nr:hypothetical protein [Halioglobus sp.]